jgi:putative ABC transport system permease protein
MRVLLKIAFRNLREHRTKTLIIGSIIALGLVILVVGNSFLDTAEEGIRKMYTENFTGHVLITNSLNESPSLFMGPGTVNGEQTPVIQEYKELLTFLEDLPGVESTVSQITGFATADIGGEGKAFLQLFSVEPENYLEMFPDTIELIDGRFLKSDETGVVLSKDVVEMLAESSGSEVKPGDKILLTNINVRSGTKIREVEIKGIIRFKSEAPNLTLVSYIDLTSMRALSGMTRVTDVSADLTGEEQTGLGAVDEKDLFGGGEGLFTDTDLNTETFLEDDLLTILGDTSEAELYRELDPNAWQYVLLKLEDGQSADRTIRSLNTYFTKNDISLRAYGWVEAAGGVAQLVSGLKTVFNGLIFVVAVVAVIIIMNTLVISITERIREIGTMRAIGAQRSFVRRMIIFETLIISLLFGIIGIGLGSGIIGILNMTGIEASNMFMQVIFGGPVLNPVLNAGSILTSLVMVVAVGILASLYPTAVALKIEPVRAMNQR